MLLLNDWLKLVLVSLPPVVFLGEGDRTAGSHCVAWAPDSASCLPGTEQVPPHPTLLVSI